MKRSMGPFAVGFIPDRWEGGVAGLSHDAEYVYFRLCAVMWATGRGVAEEDGPAACRYFPRYKKALEELARKDKIKLELGELVNSRALMQHRQSIRARDIAHARGVAGATRANASKVAQATAPPGAQGGAQAASQVSLERALEHPLKGALQGRNPNHKKNKTNLLGSETLLETETRTPLARGLRPLAACLPGSGEQENHGAADPYTDPCLDIPESLRRDKGAA